MKKLKDLNCLGGVKMKKLTSILLIITTMMMLTSCGPVKGMISTDESKEVISDPIAVETIKIDEKTLVDELYIVGQIKSNEEYSVTPYTAGIVEDILVNVGDLVKKGDVLYVLDTVDLELSKTASLLQSESSMNQSASSLELAKKDLEQNEINLPKAQKDYDDNKKLYDGGFITEQAFENYDKALESARISYDRSILTLGKSQSAYDQAIKSYNNSKSDFESKFDKMTVESPISGMVTKIDVKKDVKNTGNVGVTVTNMEDMKVSANILEKDINKITMGQQATVFVNSIGASVEGVVSSVSYSSDTNYYPVEITIENKENLFKSGMYAEVSVNVGEVNGILAVPKTSIVSKGSSKYVFINKDGYAIKTKVNIGRDFGNVVEVIDGVVIGQELVIKGQTYLEEGTPLLLK